MMPIWDQEKKRSYNHAYYRANAEALKAAEKERARRMTPERRARREEAGRVWRARNADRISAARRADYRDNPERSLFRNARARARKMGIDFDLTTADITIPALCPVLGIPITIGTSKGWSPGAPTLDRVDNTKGYVKGNVCVISWRANSLKSDATLDEVDRIATYIRDQMQRGGRRG